MDQTPAMDPTPPAWLRSYKAQSAHLPNFASQVRTELDGKPTTKAPPEPTTPEEETPKDHTADDTTATNQFAFRSTISLTLHNVGSLDKSYSNSTPDSSPKKPSFDPRLHQHPVLRQTGPPNRPAVRLTENDTHEKYRRGNTCGLFSAIRRAFMSKTQHKLAH
ncbi:MAG: hypothetical protein Q9168_006513 [Polycauliona sp. 1 TL-2023]